MLMRQQLECTKDISNAAIASQFAISLSSCLVSYLVLARCKILCLFLLLAN